MSPTKHDTPTRRPRAARAWAPTVKLFGLSFLLALFFGAVLIAASDPNVVAASKYFLSRPSDTFVAIWHSVAGAYSALFQGAVFNFHAQNLHGFIRPLTETLTWATPLIAAGLSVALAFRAGLFNIGAEGQIVLGAIGAAYVGFAWHLPPVIHMLVATAAALILGALWAGIAGVLKARTGAHEVIVTIMLNYVAKYLLAFLLTTNAFQRPGRNDPISPIIDASAAMPRLVGSWSRLHLGFIFALLAAGFVWWLLQRSVPGFRIRAVGANASAARTAGIKVERQTVLVMCIAGALAGLAGAVQILGTEKALTGGVSAGIGFDAITVALLGQGSPLGVVLAGLLFGGLKAGGFAMSARTQTPIDIVLVVQSLVVLFIAAPPLVRKIFRVRQASAGAVASTKGAGA